MNKKSGFLGVTGLSSDSRDIEAAYNEGNEKAKLALDILKHQLKKYIGGYAAAMNGLDAVVFTAGIGENSSILRELVLSDMEYLGIELDREANKKAFRLSDAMMISTPESKVKAYVIPTNEELVIAKDTAAIVENL
jgi:acetate kinase